MFAKPLVYVRLTPDRIIVKDLKSGVEFNDEAAVAVQYLKKNRQVLAVGAEAKNVPPSDDTEIIYPFKHPRLIVNDVDAGQALMQYALKHVAAKMSMLLPEVVVHWTDKLEGGMTLIEAHVLEQMAQACGAAKVYISDENRVYSDDEVKALKGGYLHPPE